MTSISATQQFKAIAYLRWCLFRNAFRRKGGAGELVARIIVYPVFAAFLIGPLIGFTTAAYFATANHHLEYLTPIFWAIFGLRCLVSINIAQPGLTFDPESLIRFPLSFSRYLVVRIMLGLLSASAVLGTFCLFGVAAGISFADPALAATAFGAALLLAVANMFFIRMIFAWIDRWLSTRRAREFLTGFIILGSLGIQYLNFTFNPGFNHGRGRSLHSASQISATVRAYHFALPVVSRLPPSLAASGIAHSAAAQAGLTVLDLLGIALFGCISTGIFAWRMQREYRGENLSEANNAPVLPASAVVVKGRRAELPALAVQEHATPRKTLLSPIVSACLAKEWIYLRRNTTQFYGLLAPIAMVFLFTLRMGSRMGSSTWLFPAAVVYSALGIAALAYNSLGLDAAGIQFYFLAPVRLGDVLLAKNLFSFAINFVEIVIIYALITYTTAAPPILVVLSMFFWLLFASLVNVTIGNMRSIISPKKMDPGKLSRRQASQLSALISLGIMLVLGGLGMGLIFLASYLHMAWLPIPIFAALAAGAFLFYRQGLGSIDVLAMKHRETMIEELCKAS